jgi:spermidine dehydrogenase
MMTKRAGDRSGNCNTTRREFVGAVVGSLVGATTLATPPTTAATAVPEPNSLPIGPSNLSSSSTNYPPMLQGLRGQTQPAMEAAHSLRDGESIPVAADTGENYDIAIVGAGMSGLAAAYFYRKALPDAKVLVLEACDDFGGHATRNEFAIGGRQLLAPGGTFEIIFPDTYTPEGKALLADIGINGERFYKMKDRSDADIKRYKLSSSRFL